MNKVFLTGRLTKEPEIRYTPSGKAVAKFNLAAQRRNAQEGQPTADFIPIVAWEKLAEICGNNLIKGSKILVEGRMQVRNYDASDGSKRYITEVVALNIEFMGNKPNATHEQGDDFPGAMAFGSEVLPDEEIPF